MAAVGSDGGDLDTGRQLSKSTLGEHGSFWRVDWSIPAFRGQPDAPRTLPRSVKSAAQAAVEKTLVLATTAAVAAAAFETTPPGLARPSAASSYDASRKIEAGTPTEAFAKTSVFSRPQGASAGSGQADPQA